MAGLRRKNNQMELRFNLDAKWQSRFFLSQESVQNERAAGIIDTDQRGLGMLPQQANLRRLHRRENQENE